MTVPSDSVPQPSPPDADSDRSAPDLPDDSRTLPQAPSDNLVVRRLEMRYHATFLVVSIIILLLSFLMNLEGHAGVAISLGGQTLPSLCTFRNLTGWDCPGCGMTRSFISLAHGQWYESLNYHPLGWLMFGMVAFQIPFRGVQLSRLRRGLQPLYWPAAVWLGWGFMILLVGQWVIRGIMRG